MTFLPPDRDPCGNRLEDPHEACPVKAYRSREAGDSTETTIRPQVYDWGAWVGRWVGIRGRNPRHPTKSQYNDTEALRKRPNREEEENAKKRILEGRAWTPHHGATAGGTWFCVTCGKVAPSPSIGRSTPCPGWITRLTAHAWSLVRHPAGASPDAGSQRQAEAVQQQLSRRRGVG